MITQGSIGIVGKQKLLSSALYEACTKLGVPEAEHDELVDKGRDLFTVDGNGRVTALGQQWPDIKSFISCRGLKVLQPKTSAINAAEKRTKRKAELLDLLAHYAVVGDVQGYRQTRELYAAL